MLEDLYYTLMRAETNGKPVKKIKVTSTFAAYLSSVHKDEMLYQASCPKEVYGFLFGIPIVIDNTIEPPYYKLVFEED